MVALGAPCCDAPADDAAPSLRQIEDGLRRDTQALLDAIAPGDAAVWDRLLDERAIQVDENDVVRDKKQILAELRPLGPGLVGHLEVDDFRAVVHGDVAVVTHEDREYLDYHGQVIHSRFRMTDTWLRKSAGWRLIASQALAVLQDPPPARLEPRQLCAYAGRYQLTAEIVGTVTCNRDELLFGRPGRPSRHFVPELADVFFEPGQPRTRRIFQRDAAGTLSGFVDRREGRDIRWTRIDGTAP
jgi:hypothetical protein